MDRRERSPEPEEVLRMAFASMATRLWVALPGVVDSFDAAKMSVNVQPVINGRALDQKGAAVSLQMPLLLDCPVLWQGGGGATLTFPIKRGDECLVVFSSRCIDAWWGRGWQPPASGQAANPANDPPEPRTHNLSDGFAIVGVRSVPRAFAVDTTFAMLRADDGATFVKLDPAGQLVTVAAPGGINLNGVTIDSSGNLHSPAKISAPNVETDAGKKLGTHRHTETGSITLGPDNT